MGKAAILVAPVTIVVVGLIIWGIIWMVNRTPQDPKSVRQRAELADDAYELIRDMLYPRNIDVNDMTVLSENHKTKIKSWAEKYRKVQS